MTEPGLDAVEARLRAERPLPSPGFRGELRRRFGGRGEGRAVRPRNPVLLVTAYAGSGALLLLVAALSLTGVGPFAA